MSKTRTAPNNTSSRLFRHLADLYRTHGRVLRSSRPMTAQERETLAGILDSLALQADARAAGLARARVGVDESGVTLKSALGDILEAEELDIG